MAYAYSRGSYSCDLLPPPDLPDSDNDGIPDRWDLYPNDPTVYRYSVISRIVNRTTDETEQITIKTDQDDVFTFGERPSDMSDSIDVINIAPVLNDADTLQDLPFFDTGSGGENTTSNFIDLLDFSGIVTDVVNTGTTPATGSGTNFNDDSLPSDDTESDNDALRKIITNTHSTSENIGRLGDYLQSINQTLNRMDTKDDFRLSGSLNEDSESDNGPSAEEIGQSVNDNLIDSTQTHDDSQTTSISSYNFGTKFDDEKTKYVTRFTTFTDVFKNSTLFTLPDTLIGSVPSGGVSTYDVNIGKWGSTTDSIISFDFANYSVAWDMLKYVLPILTAFSVLKILILKQH